jgi:hypothetical protein
MARELFVWGKYVTYNYFREKTKIYKRNPRQVAGALFPSPTPFSLPPLYIYVTQWWYSNFFAILHHKNSASTMIL